MRLHRAVYIHYRHLGRYLGEVQHISPFVSRVLLVQTFTAAGIEAHTVNSVPLSANEKRKIIQAWREVTGDICGAAVTVSLVLKDSATIPHAQSVSITHLGANPQCLPSPKHSDPF